MTKLEYLLTMWESMGNAYGTEEGGWKHRATAAKMVEQLLKLGYEGSELVTLGRISDEEGWEPAASDISYSHYCVTDSTGEYVLQPGEDDEGDELTEQGVRRMHPPKGFTLAFVA